MRLMTSNPDHGSSDHFRDRRFVAPIYKPISYGRNCMLDIPFEVPEYLDYFSPIFPDAYDGFIDIRQCDATPTPRLELVINDSGSASLKPCSQGNYEMEQYLAFSSSDDEDTMDTVSTLSQHPSILTNDSVKFVPGSQKWSCPMGQNEMADGYRFPNQPTVIEDPLRHYYDSRDMSPHLTISPLKLKRKPTFEAGYYEFDSNLQFQEACEQGVKDGTKVAYAAKRQRIRFTPDKITFMMHKSPCKINFPRLMPRQLPAYRYATNRVGQLQLQKDLVDNPKRRMQCCHEHFKTYFNFAAHLDAKHGPLFRPWVCPDETCPWSALGFFTLSDCTRHYVATHNRKVYVCKVCAYWGINRRFGRIDALRRHVVENHIHPT